MKLTEEQIKEIADNLDSGLRCFYNKRTGVIKEILNFNSWINADEETWEEELREIEENWSDFYEFENMTSGESFNLMADFAENIDNPGLQKRLINALNRSKPFRNFKWQIDNSGEYRQLWFEFKNNRYIEWVKDQIETQNRNSDNDYY